LDQENPDLSRQQICRGVRNDIDIFEQVSIVSGVAGGTFLALGLAHWLATSDSTEASVTVKDGASKTSGSVTCAPGFMNVVCAGTF
jgi:hypothetical protein